MRLNATDEKRVKPVSNELFTNCELRSTTSNHSSAKRWFCFAPIFWFHFAFRCNGMRSRIRMECFINDLSAHRNVNNLDDDDRRESRANCQFDLKTSSMCSQRLLFFRFAFEWKTISGENLNFPFGSRRQVRRRSGITSPGWHGGNVCGNYFACVSLRLCVCSQSGGCLRDALEEK